MDGSLAKCLLGTGFVQLADLAAKLRACISACLRLVAALSRHSVCEPPARAPLGRLDSRAGRTSHSQSTSVSPRAALPSPPRLASLSFLAQYTSPARALHLCSHNNCPPRRRCRRMVVANGNVNAHDSTVSSLPEAFNQWREAPQTGVLLLVWKLPLLAISARIAMFAPRDYCARGGRGASQTGRANQLACGPCTRAGASYNIEPPPPPLELHSQQVPPIARIVSKRV